MSTIVLALGVVITGAGLIAIGFGIPINDLGLRHTLITAGTTAVAGGLILVGLSAAIAQLTKIAEAVRPRAPARTGRPVEGSLKSSDAAAPEPRVEPRVPVPEPKRPEPLAVDAKMPDVAPPEWRLNEPTVAEPRPAPVLAPGPDRTLEVSASAIERLRSSMPPRDRAKGEGMPTAEEVPLSPNGSNGVHPPVPAPAAPPRTEPTVTAKAANGAAHPETAAEAKGPRLDFLFRSKNTRPGQAETFDALWPKRPVRGGAQPDKQPAPRPAAADKPPAAEVAQPVSVAPAVRTEEPRTAGILKSGVVDGMAYTLYSDGSIEAQLPQGTVRFGSIAELRAHIENNP